MFHWWSGSFLKQNSHDSLASVQPTSRYNQLLFNSTSNMPVISDEVPPQINHLATLDKKQLKVWIKFFKSNIFKNSFYTKHGECNAGQKQLQLPHFCTRWCDLINQQQKCMLPTQTFLGVWETSNSQTNCQTVKLTCSSTWKFLNSEDLFWYFTSLCFQLELRFSWVISVRNTSSWGRGPSLPDKKIVHIRESTSITSNFLLF